MRPNCPWQGTTYFLQCDSTHHLSGYGILRCVGNGTYDLPVPTCEGNTWMINPCFTRAFHRVSTILDYHYC